MIFRIVATALNYPDDLIVLYEISAKIDSLQFEEMLIRFEEKNIIERIKSEANSLLELND